MNRAAKPIDVLVLGLGNELLTDDGAGVHVIRMLQKEPSPEGVLAAEIGTGILHAQHLLEQVVQVIAVDAVQAGDEPGAVYRFDLDQVPLKQPASLHDVGIAGLMQLIPKSDRPEVTVVGIEPEKIDFGMELSPAVQAAVPGVVSIVKKMIASILSRRAVCCVGCKSDSSLRLRCFLSATD